jgi:hypothetical protein
VERADVRCVTGGVRGTAAEWATPTRSGHQGSREEESTNPFTAAGWLGYDRVRIGPDPLETIMELINKKVSN